MCWPTDEGPSTLKNLQNFQDLQRAENLPEHLPVNLNEDNCGFIQRTCEQQPASSNTYILKNKEKEKDTVHTYGNTKNVQRYVNNTKEKQTLQQSIRTAAPSTQHNNQLNNPNPHTHKRSRRSKNKDTVNYLSTSTSQTCTEGVSNLYIDLGDAEYSCEYCNATFWYNERLKRNGHQSHPKYTNCCGGGQVYLKKETDPPEYLKQLFKNKHFLDNIRAYNQMFSMTSFGAEIDESINNGKGPYVFRISGQIHHWIGTLCPSNGQDPRFLQLYIYDTENEIRNRMEPFGGTERSGLNAEIVERLIQVLDEHNELVKLFRTTRDKLNEGNVPEFKIKLYNVVGVYEYQLPSSRTLGGIVFQIDANTQTDYDIIIEYKDRRPKRINKLHSTYMALHFPLLFIYGQPGYNTKMTLKGMNATRTRKKLSMNMYYKYQLHERLDEFGLLFRGGRLFQQYVVIVYCTLEQERLDFIRSKQNSLRKECLSGICDAMSKGDHVGAGIGQKIILPSSFTGGPRYMYSHYLDALAICRVLGNPHFFITFTCNTNWPEIKRRMRKYPELTPADRPDIVGRVFEQKVEDFLTVLKEHQIFSRCTGGK